jgi:hypothetical protein
MQTIEAIAVRSNVMDRLKLTERLVKQLEHGEAVIGGIGNANFDLFGAGDRPQNFYQVGSRENAGHTGDRADLVGRQIVDGSSVGRLAQHAVGNADNGQYEPGKDRSSGHPVFLHPVRYMPPRSASRLPRLTLTVYRTERDRLISTAGGT